MDVDLLLLRGLYAFSAFFACAFFVQRYRWRRARRLGKRRFGFYPRASSLGNALQHLQITAQPQVQHILDEKQDEDPDADDEAGAKDPIRHLRRQAARLRRGERIEQLTAHLPGSDRA